MTVMGSSLIKLVGNVEIDGDLTVKGKTAVQDIKHCWCRVRRRGGLTPRRACDPG
jgi:hypothetical protein